jgi:hypothetical protein
MRHTGMGLINMMMMMMMHQDDLVAVLHLGFLSSFTTTVHDRAIFQKHLLPVQMVYYRRD